MKLLIAGNPTYGFSSALKARYPTATFASRSEGNWDLTTTEHKRQLASLSLQYDVFISVSCLWKFNQVLLVQEVISQWIKNDHAGYIIAIGSSADTPIKGTEWLYPVEKKSLRAYCRQLSQISAGENKHKFKVTYLSPGNLHTPLQDEKMPQVNKIDCGYLANVVDWLLNQPWHINISELCLDRIP
jgi:hypothetical protein